MTGPTPTPEQADAAERLGISLHFTQVMLSMARVIEIVDALQQRVQALEQKRSSWLGK